jgi:hypothetical protein
MALSYPLLSLQTQKIAGETVFMNKPAIRKDEGCSAEGLCRTSVVPSASMANNLKATITCFGDAALTSFGHIRVYSHGLV